MIDDILNDLDVHTNMASKAFEVTDELVVGCALVPGGNLLMRLHL